MMRQTLPATLKDISSFMPTVETYLDDLPTEMRVTIVLAIQELLVNVVNHAYAGEAGTIDFELLNANHRVSVTVRDQAKKTFTMPDSVNPPDPLELPEHGMGLFIIHEAFDEVHYERLANGNQWKLLKGGIQ